MPPEPLFINDPYVTYTRKCVVFPAQGSEPQVVDMTIRTVTTEDTGVVGCYSRTVDLLGTYGSEYCKMRVHTLHDNYMLHYNMSPKLPLNGCIARLLDIDPDTNNIGSKLFWRGDAVAMKFELQSEHSSYINCYNADSSAIGNLEEKLREAYSNGILERELFLDEQEWKDYCCSYSNWSTVLNATITGHHPFWGRDWRRQEAEFLDHLNELRVHSGPVLLRTPPGLLEMGSATILKPLRLFFPYKHVTTGSPAFPPELERRIFETCARNNRETCLELVLVAHRVRNWIDPILFETVILDDSPKGHGTHTTKPHTVKSNFELFAANIDCRPPEFYSSHVKNLWMAHSDLNAFERILTVCSGVENLVLFPRRHFTSTLPTIHLLEHLNASSRLRKMTVNLEKLSTLSAGPNFGYACFANITHLHLYDDTDDDWPTYMGFEHLRSLTHFAAACCGPAHLAIAIPKLPTVEYVALCHYSPKEYGRPTVNRSVHIVESYAINVVWVDGLTTADWERGATGGTDFWDLVEEEVARRRVKDECVRTSKPLADNNLP